MTTIRRERLRAALLAAGSLGALAIAAPALAQNQGAQTSSPTAPSPADAQPSTTNEVIVTGYRASLQSALLQKRDSILPIESIAPEDIGKFPDQDVAESLQRLPGVQIDRSQGIGTSVLIDGLRQNLTTLNGDIFLTGKEFYVSGEASGNGAGANAQYNSLEGIPSEEIGGIDVYKNPKASMTEGGLGGTIDLKTRDPLAQPMGFHFGGNLRGVSADDTNSTTPNGTLVVSWKPSSRIAFTGSVSYDEEDTHTKEYQDANRSQWLITNSASPPYTGAPTGANLTTLPGGQTYIDPQLGYFSDINDTRKTLGASIGFAAKITDAITTRFNWFYSREDDTTITYSDKVWFNGQGTSPGTLLPGIDPTQPYSIAGNGVVQSGVFAANGAETATLYQHDISQANNLQWGTRYDNGGPFRADLNLAWARATSNLQADQADVEHGLYDTFAGVPTSPTAPGCNNGAVSCPNPPGPGNHGYNFSYSNGGTSGLPSVSYLAPYADVLSNPNYTTFKSNWAWANLTKQQQYSIRADAQYDPPILQNLGFTVSAGVRYGDRSVDQTFGRYLIEGLSASGQPLANCCQDPNGGTWLYYLDPGYIGIPYSTAVSSPGLAKTVNNFGVGNIIVKNPATMTNPSTFLDQVWSQAGVGAYPNNTEKFFVDGLSSFRVHETTTAGYIMGDLGNRTSRFHLNFGVRIVETDLTINNGAAAQVPTYYGTASWNGVDSNVVPTTTTRSYTDVLPSFNLTYDLTDKQILRLSAAKVVSPQDLYQLGLGDSYNFTRQVGSRTNIHTGLQDGFAFDGGSSGNPNLDPYRATQGLISYENYFAKGALISIAGFWKQIDNFVEIESIPTLVDDDFGGTTRDVSKPENAGSGRVYGIELGGQYAFDDRYYPWLKGFGVAANYTFSDSQTDSVTSFSTKSTIPGVSKNSFTGTVYYERYGFTARTSYSWRDTAVNDSAVGSTFSFPDMNNVNHVYQVYSAPYGQLDAQIGYDFNPHVGLVFSVQNITNEAQHTYLQWKDNPFTYDQSGRRFFFGLKFKG